MKMTLVCALQNAAHSGADRIVGRPIRRPVRTRRHRDRDSPEADLYSLQSFPMDVTYAIPRFEQTAKLQVENLHYDLTEEDLEVCKQNKTPNRTLY